MSHKIREIKDKFTLEKSSTFNLVEKPKYNQSLFFSPKEFLFEIQLKKTLLGLLYSYTQDNVIPKFFQNNKNNENAYLHFYTLLSAKIDTLKIIGLDHGKNIALAPNLACKFFCSLTYLVDLASSTILTFLAATTRYGINKLSERKKIRGAKNKLNHLITDPSFIRLISVILTKIHETDFAHQEELNRFVKEQFKIFWTLFKSQAKIETERTDLPAFWSTCLIEYFKVLESPLVKDNLAGCLHEMLASVNPTLEACPQKVTELNVNESNQSKNINQPITENIYLSRLILQMARLILQIATYYLTQLMRFMDAAKMSPQAPAFSVPTFWQKPTQSRVDFSQTIIVVQTMIYT